MIYLVIRKTFQRSHEPFVFKPFPAIMCENILQSSNTAGNSNSALLDKCIILDILDNDFAVSSIYSSPF